MYIFKVPAIIFANKTEDILSYSDEQENRIWEQKVYPESFELTERGLILPKEETPAWRYLYESWIVCTYIKNNYNENKTDEYINVRLLERIVERRYYCFCATSYLLYLAENQKINTEDRNLKRLILNYNKYMKSKLTKDNGVSPNVIQTYESNNSTILQLRQNIEFFNKWNDKLILYILNQGAVDRLRISTLIRCIANETPSNNNCFAIARVSHNLYYYAVSGVEESSRTGFSYRLLKNMSGILGLEDIHFTKAKLPDQDVEYLIDEDCVIHYSDALRIQTDLDNIHPKWRRLFSCAERKVYSLMMRNGFLDDVIVYILKTSCYMCQDIKRQKSSLNNVEIDEIRHTKDKTIQYKTGDLQTAHYIYIS